VTRGRVAAATAAVVLIAAVLTYQRFAGDDPGPDAGSGSTATATAGVSAAPQGPSWAPKPRRLAGLNVLSTAGRTTFALHTDHGDVTFLAGVNLGSTTPGHQPGELSISVEQYRRWFEAMGALGVRVVRIYTIHPPAFYREMARYNRARPTQPLFLMQGVYLPDESYVAKGDIYHRAVTTTFQRELRDAADAVAGSLRRGDTPGRASGTWDTDVNPWLAGWIVGVEFDPGATAASDLKNAGAPSAKGDFFRSTNGATPTERWLAARMDELAGYQAGRGLSQPIAFVNWPTTDPLRHPDEPLSSEDLLQLDANHVRPTQRWPAGTFASYHAYPYYPDFLRHEAALQNLPNAGRADPYAGYLAALKKHHAGMPTMITEFGVPSSIGSAHNGTLGRDQGGHSEQDAMRIDADLLRLISRQGLAGGLLFSWADEWFKFTWNTVAHQDRERRQLWHDPLTNEQHFGLVAMDAAGSPDNVAKVLADGVTARVDESYLHIAVPLTDPPPASLTLSFDVLPAMSGPPPPGSLSREADAAVVLDLTGRTGQAYLRDELDPLPLDWRPAASVRGSAPDGWQRFELMLNRDLILPRTGEKLPAEIQNAGLLRYGDPVTDSRSLWSISGRTLTVRVPWGFLGFADPSAHQVGVPKRDKAGRATPRAETSPGVRVIVSAGGVDRALGDVTWAGWNRVYHTERLKTGADAVRAAMRDVTSD